MSTEINENDFLKKKNEITNARLFLEKLSDKIELLLFLLDGDSHNFFVKKQLLNLSIKGLIYQLTEVDPFVNQDQN